LTRLKEGSNKPERCDLFWFSLAGLQISCYVSRDSAGSAFQAFCRVALDLSRRSVRSGSLDRLSADPERRNHEKEFTSFVVSLFASRRFAEYLNSIKSCNYTDLQMDELFTFLSSSARLKKPSKKKRQREQASPPESDENDDNSMAGSDDEPVELSRDRTGKRDMSDEKQKKVHREQIAAFRRSMAIRVANKHDPELPDPMPSFSELSPPSWWSKGDSFRGICTAIQRNIEVGRWKEPTAVQMQAIPTLMAKRDLIGAAPTGSGKSGGFIIPALFLSSAPYNVYYDSETPASPSNKKKKKKGKGDSGTKQSREGDIRALVLAPSRELAAQLHREVERLGAGKPGGLSSLLLSKSNAAHAISGTAGGKSGLDVLVSTPLRLVDAIEKGLRLDSVRLVVLDEADRLLDAADGTHGTRGEKKSSEEEEEAKPASGSSQSQTFLVQMDVILSSIPTTAARALFSATVTSTVQSLAESILRNPVDLKIAAPGSYGGANTDIEQELMFVGREEGKLLAMRQLKDRGHLKPPAIVFVQSQDRAQALFAELLYDGMHVDVIHAGRSRTARDNAVAKFRKGETWVLICTDLVSRGVDFRAVNMVINYDLPMSGITYVHRIGRTGRAGRKGKAITLFTEGDFVNLRTIANVMKQSGCKVEDWMLQLRKNTRKDPAPRRSYIDTTPNYDKKKVQKKKQIIQHSKKNKEEEAS
jgi:ATP-dependent RNA helicase DDX52/ROK1